MNDKSGAAIYGGAALAVFSVNEICMIIGTMVAVLGFLYNVFHTTQLREIAREKGVRIQQ